MKAAWRQWAQASHISAGLVAVLVGYTSSAAIVFQAAHAAQASAAQLTTWLMALGLGMGLTCIFLSLRYRTPILTAWSTPGAALLASSLLGLSMAEAVGAFLLSSVLITLCGMGAWFERLLHYIPKSLAAAMLAGVLLRFGLDAFTHLPRHPWLIGSMLLCFLLGRRYWPRYAVVWCFALGLAIVMAQGELAWDKLAWGFSAPVWTTPVFSWSSAIGVALPLFLVTMASQNLPGLAVLRANAYHTPAAPLIATTGLTGVLLAPFGGFAFSLAAITAAICMSREADPDPAQRYRAAVWAGVFYLLTGLFAATVASLLVAMPRALVVAIAGLALLGTIGNSLHTALAEESEREAALIAFLVTASGMSIFSIGSAFWGLVFGVAALAVARWRKSAAL